MGTALTPAPSTPEQRSMTSPPDPVSSAAGMHEASRREKLRRIQQLGHRPLG